MFKTIFEFFTPKLKQCIFCHSQGLVSSNNLSLCKNCVNKIPWIHKVECETCGRYEACHDCKRRETAYFLKSRSAVQYTDQMREWLARYKYRGDESLLPLLVEMMRPPFESLQHSINFDFITFTPLSHERLVERGFNQAGQLAHRIANLYKIPVVPLLQRLVHTGKQSYKTRGQRLKDLTNVFTYVESEIVNRTHKVISNEPLHILIIDDVYTTGSTMNQCAAVISKHLNARVYGLTWAR